MRSHESGGRRLPLSAGTLPRRHLLRSAAFVAGGVALGLTGCSGGKRASTSGSAATRAATGAATGSTGAPGATTAASQGAASTLVQVANSRTGGVIHAAAPGGQKLDPVATAHFLAQWASGFHYSRLFRFK